MIIKKIQDLSTPVLIIQEQIDQVQPKIWNKKKELRDILEDILCEFNDIENKRANLKQIEVKANKLATEILEIKKHIEEI
jgi:chromosome segregation ATPase